MKTVKLDASSWTTAQDFYDAILPALGAPGWHGRNVNALVESIVQGEINELAPPFKIEVSGAGKLPPSLSQELAWAAEDVRAAKADFAKRWGTEPDVSFEVRP